MSEPYSNAEVEIIWKAKGRFQWRVVDGDVLISQGEQASVTLARDSAHKALMAARGVVWIG